MRRLSPPIRTGVVAACTHQALLAAGLWDYIASVNRPHGFFKVPVIWSVEIVDFPLLFLRSCLPSLFDLLDRIEIRGSRPIYGTLHSYSSDTSAFLFFAIFGALQWFLLAYGIASLRARKKRQIIPATPL